jgi:hypothetical protein
MGQSATNLTAGPARVKGLATEVNRHLRWECDTDRIEHLVQLVDVTRWGVVQVNENTQLRDAFASPESRTERTIVVGKLLVPLVVRQQARRRLPRNEQKLKKFLEEPPKMDAEISLDTIRERQRAYLVNHYLVLQITVVSVALAMACVSAASLIARPVNLDLALLGLLWFGSLLAIAVAYGGPMTGALVLPPSIPTITDLLLPLAIGVAEFLLFAVLISQVTRSAQLNTVIDAWFWVMAAFAAIAFLTTIRARYIINEAMARGAYDSGILESVGDYVARLTLRGPGSAATLAAAGGILRLTGFKEEWLTFLIVISINALIIVGLCDHGGSAELWRNRLATEPDQEVTR